MADEKDDENQTPTPTQAENDAAARAIRGLPEDETDEEKAAKKTKDDEVPTRTREVSTQNPAGPQPFKNR